MSNVARCKFNIVSVTDLGNNQRKIDMSAVCDSSIPEDRAFTKYTPSGTMSIMLTNPNVFGIFVAGTQVYIDITPCATVAGP